MSIITIKQFGDLHFTDSFSLKKLSKIEGKICDGKTDYVMFIGDLINSNDFLRDNPDKREVLLKWLESISSNCKLIMTLGNHDIFSKNNNGEGWINSKDDSFWEEVSNIKGIELLSLKDSYEDDKIQVFSINQDFNYYENSTKREDKNKLLNELKKKKQLFENLDSSKLNILLVHSPIYISDNDILEYINPFDLILSGHMHNGCVHPLVSCFFPKNRGIISPNNELLPNNSRGIKNIRYSDKLIKLIITGGITKISLPDSVFGKLNSLFPMNIEEIKYDEETKDTQVRSISF